MLFDQYHLGVGYVGFLTLFIYYPLYLTGLIVTCAGSKLSEGYFFAFQYKVLWLTLGLLPLIMTTCGYDGCDYG